MKFDLRWTWRTYIAFCLLAYLVSACHELAHHIVGFVSSGQFGRMSLNLFANAENAPHPVLVSLAGPSITYLVAWTGAVLLLSGSRKALGYALVAGSASYMRLVGVIGGGGDESVVSRTLTGTVHRPVLVAIVAVLVLPPILIAFHSLKNRNRVWVFIASMFGPFIPLIFVRMADQRWFAANVNAPENFHGMLVGGIPVAVLMTHLAVVLAFILFGARQLSKTDREMMANA